MKYNNTQVQNTDNSPNFFSGKTVNALKIALTAILVILVFKSVGLERIVRTFVAKDPEVFAAGLFIGMISFFCVVLLFKKLIMWGGGPEIKFGELFLDVARMSMFSTFTPASSGQVLIVKLLSDRGLEAGGAWAVFFIYKLINYITILLLALVGAAFLLRETSYVLAILLIIIALAAFFSLVIFEKPREFMKKTIGKKVSGKFTGFSDSLQLIAKRKRRAFGAFGLKILHRIFSAAIFYIAIYSISRVSIGLIEILLLMSVVDIVAAIPVTVGGFGLREGSGVVLFSALGVPGAVVVSAYLFLYVIRYLVLGGSLVLLTKKYGL